MKTFRIAELVDTAALQDMADSLYESTGMPIGIIDAIDNSILVGAGWQDICTKFHRLHPEMLSRCQESDNYIKNHLQTGEACKYKCKNGLWDIGMPITVAGKHLATMFLGQFFYEDEIPERAYFVAQGQKFGLDIEEYLQALDQVPYFTKEKVENILTYNKALVSFITSLAESALSRNKAEQQLWEQTQIMQGVLEHTHMMAAYLDCRFNFVWVNRAYADTCKRSSSFFTGKNHFALYPHQENQVIFQKVVDTGEPFFVEAKPFAFSDQPERGTTYWDWSLIPVKNRAGTVIGLVFTLAEVTQRVKAEEVTRQSEKKFRTLVENTIDWVWQVDNDGVYNYVSPQVEPLLGYKPTEIVGKTPFDFMAAAEAERVRKIFAGISSQQERIVGLEDRMLAKDGQEIIFETNATPLFDEQDSFIGYMGTCRDITERKTNEQEKKKADGLLLWQQKAISLNNRIANVFLTTSGKDIFVNTLEVLLETLESPFGYFGFINDDGDLNCPSITRDIWNQCDVPDKSVIFPKATWGGLWGKSLQKQETVISNGDLHLPEGHTQLTCAMAVPIMHHDELIGQFVVANKEGGYGQHEKFLLESAASQTAPILNSLLEKEAQKKEHKRMRARMEQAQKMEAIGNLAGGIAHDFNNLLSPIIGFSELMLATLEPDSVVYKRVQRINEAGNRAKDLVSRILSFSRLSDLEMMPVKFQKVLKEVLKLCRATIPKNIEIDEAVQQDCGAIWANATQLHQIGMNLITNAYHAVQDKNGKITIALTEVLLGQNDVSNLSLRPGKYALLAVSDNGGGMSEETKNKMFEPYFTTKEKGKGTGLGLAVVYGIVQELGGEATVESQVGAGTTFTIYLPLMKKTVSVESKQVKVDMQRGHEHILVVDDEPPITQLLQAALEGLGYTVTARVSSLDALEAFQENPDRFDMVVSDMSMPHMTGDQLAQEIRRIRPKMPIVICTGFSERINKETAEEIGVNGFLLKPMVISEMADVVRKVLDEVGCYRASGK